MAERTETVRMLRARLVGSINREVGDLVELEEAAAEHFVRYKDAEYLVGDPDVVGDDEADDDVVRSILAAGPVSPPDGPGGEPAPAAEGEAPAEAAPAAEGGRRGQRLPAR